MACACTFEPKLQIDCVMEIVRVVRKGDMLGNYPELLQHSGCILGSLGTYLDSDSVTMCANAHDLPVSLEEAAAEVEASLVGATADAALNPALIALIMRLIELLISKYLK